MSPMTFEEVGFMEWWQVLLPGHHTTSGTVKIKPKLYSPELDTRRNIWLRLPSSYFHTTRRYPLIVMQDGQNLFDDSSATFGHEWGVDETLLQLEPILEAIVVGVDNARNSAKRGREYVPWKDGSVAGKYLAFLTEQVIPLVRAACPDRISEKPEHTLIMGSSYGAIFSLYAFFERPDVFGLCGAMSPSNVAGLHTYLRSQSNVHGRVYVDNGSGEACDGGRVARSLQRIGFASERSLFYRHDDGDHSEASWRKRLPEALQLLFR